MKNNKIQHTEELALINKKILTDGESLPSVKLSDGTAVQTGTVAAMLHNVNLYNNGERGAVEDELRKAVPTLIKVGLFDLFLPKEWINGDNKGRKFIGEEAKKHFR